MGDILEFIKHRPFIFITLLYAAILIILDYTGFFSSPPKNNIGHYISNEPALIEGRLISPPEQKTNRIVIELETKKVNGAEASGRLLLTIRASEENSECSLVPGDIIRFRAKLKKPLHSQNPGGFDYAQYLQRRNIYAIASAALNAVKKTGHEKPGVFSRIARAASNDISRKIRANIPEREADVLGKMLIGDRTAISQEDREKFTNAGVMHILVVSGLNVAYVAAFFWFVFRIFGTPAKTAGLLTIPFIFLYVLATGANPPIVRAGVMACFIILSLSLARDANVFQSLALAAFTILIINPQSLFTASFQLSFAATAGIVLLYAPLSSPFRRLPAPLRWLCNTAAVTVAAQLAVSPLLAYYFSKLSLIGLLSNILIVPLAGLITLTGLAFYISFYIAPWVTAALAFTNYHLVHFILMLVDYFASMKYAVVNIAAPSLLTVFAYYFALAVILAFNRLSKITKTAAVLTALALAGFSVHDTIPNGRLRVTFLAVGYADAIHIAFPNGKNWLVDCGSGIYDGFDAGEKIITPYLRSKGINTLDKIMLTHPHLQHFSGTKAVLNNFRVRSLAICPEPSTEAEYIELLGLLKGRNVPIQTLWAGYSFIEGGVTVKVISPAALSDDNEGNCIALLVSYVSQSMLLTSDISNETERALVKKYPNIKADIVQVPAHGRFRTSYPLLLSIRPEYAIISTGSQDAKLIPQKAFSTAKDGAVTFTLTKDKISVTTHTERTKL